MGQPHPDDAGSFHGTGSLRWRVVDIVVASVLAVAAGLVFVIWNVAHSPITAPLNETTTMQLGGFHPISPGDGVYWVLEGQNCSEGSAVPPRGDTLEYAPAYAWCVCVRDCVYG